MTKVLQGVQSEKPSLTEIIGHLKSICASETFARSPQSKRLLRYLVSEALKNSDPGAFKGTVIGIEVFGLSPTHDPRRRSIVRVTIGALRDGLSKYYEVEGRSQPVRIHIPARSYRPEFYYDPSFATLKLDPVSAMHVANARAMMNRRTLTGFREAHRYLELALARHCEHPRLLALVAINHAASAMYGEHPRGAFEKARSFVARARQSGQETWELPLVEAWIVMNLDFDWVGAERLFERAIAPHTTEALHHTWYTAFLASQLRWGEFLSLEQDAASGDEYDSPYCRSRLALAQLVTGDLQAAADTLRQCFELFPRPHYMALLTLGLLREAMCDFRGAAIAFEQIALPTMDTTIGIGLRALAVGLAGDKTTAQRLYEELLVMRRGRDTFVPATQLGYACVGTGDLDVAIEWLHEGYINECDPMSSWVAILPGTRHLRGEGAFIELVKHRLKLKFPDETIAPKIAVAV